MCYEGGLILYHVYDDFNWNCYACQYYINLRLICNSKAGLDLGSGHSKFICFLRTRSILCKQNVMTRIQCAENVGILCTFVDVTPLLVRR